MHVILKHLPLGVIRSYNLTKIIAPDGYVHIKIKKSTSGLKQAAILAYQNLVQNISKHGYTPIPQIFGMWKHTMKPIIFCLCVDNFGIKYCTKDNVDHLLNKLQQTYKVTTYWEGKH